MPDYLGMTSCTRRFSIDAAHRVMDHESRCKYLHGHTYLIEVTCQAPKLDTLGRVIDFGQIKQLVGGWLEENWDHNSILRRDDPILSKSSGVDDLARMIVGREPYVMDCNPTAENLARHLFGIVTDLLKDVNVSITHVRVWETPNCYADYIDNPTLAAVMKGVPGEWSGEKI